MMPSDEDLRILDALGRARREHPALVDLLSLYYDLCQVQFQAKADLREPVVRDDLSRHWRLEGGIPQLTFDQLGVEPEPFSRLVNEIARLLVLHDHPSSRVQDRAWTPGELVDRAREIVRASDMLIAPRTTGDGFEAHVANGLTAQAVGFALAAYLQWAAARILPQLDLSLWHHGYCPICGGRPHLALLHPGGTPRKLVCSRCAAVWDYAGEACPFCESSAMQYFLVSKDGMRRLYVCPGCNGYLKAVDLSRAEGEVVPLVEYLLTVGMDLEARQEGYGF